MPIGCSTIQSQPELADLLANLRLLSGHEAREAAAMTQRFSLYLSAKFSSDFPLLDRRGISAWTAASSRFKGGCQARSFRRLRDVVRSLKLCQIVKYKFLKERRNDDETQTDAS